MNSALTLRKQHLTFFGVSMALAALIAGGSVFLVKQRLNHNVSHKGVSRAAVVDCVATLKGTGFSPDLTRVEEQISVEVPSSESLEQLVTLSGVAIAACPTYEVSSYCAGPGCGASVLSFVLTAKDKPAKK